MPSPLPKRHITTLIIHDEELLLTTGAEVYANELVERSLLPGMLRNALPGEVFHYTISFHTSGPGSAAVTFLIQADLSAGQSAFHGFLRNVSNIGTDRAGIAVCKGMRGIAKRVDELAEILSKASPMLLSTRW